MLRRSETPTLSSVEQQLSSQLFTASSFLDYSTASFIDASAASVSSALPLVNRVAALPQAVSSTASSKAVSSTASSQAVSSAASPLLLRSSSSLLLSSLKPSPIPPINQEFSFIKQLFSLMT